MLLCLIILLLIAILIALYYLIERPSRESMRNECRVERARADHFEQLYRTEKERQLAALHHRRRFDGQHNKPLFPPIDMEI